MPTKKLIDEKTMIEKKIDLLQSSGINRIQGKKFQEEQNKVPYGSRPDAHGTKIERLHRAAPKPLSVPRMPTEEINVASELEYAAWLESRQIQDRHNSLLRRLEGLAQDAQIERLDKAAALLRQTAEAFRNALREKKS